MELTVGQLKKLLADLPEDMEVMMVDKTITDCAMTIHHVYVGVFEHGAIMDIPGENTLILEVL